jgi:heme exporter protein C
LTVARLKNEIISKESHRPWVIQLAQAEKGE